MKFRCISVYPDSSPYYGTLDAFLILPTGIILRRWENVQTILGVASFKYWLGDAPAAGTYTVKCIVMGYEATSRFDVIEFYQWKTEVNVTMPSYFLSTSPGVSGVVVAKYEYKIILKLNQ